MHSFGVFGPFGTRENGENVKVWSTTYSNNATNAGRPPLLSSAEQLSLVLVRLRLGLFEKEPRIQVQSLHCDSFENMHNLD